MNKLSNETNWAYALMQAIVLIEVCLGKVHWLFLLMLPFGYGFTWLYCKIFFWDKRKPFEIIVSSPHFRIGDLLKFGSNSTALVTGINDEGMQIRLNVYPVKVSKYKLINKAKFIYIRFSSWLRNKVR